MGDRIFHMTDREASLAAAPAPPAGAGQSVCSQSCQAILKIREELFEQVPVVLVFCLGLLRGDRQRETCRSAGPITARRVSSKTVFTITTSPWPSGIMLLNSRRVTTSTPCTTRFDSHISVATAAASTRPPPDHPVIGRGPLGPRNPHLKPLGAGDQQAQS